MDYCTCLQTWLTKYAELLSMSLDNVSIGAYHHVVRKHKDKKTHNIAVHILSVRELTQATVVEHIYANETVF